MKVSYRQLAAYFLKAGSIGFGGPLALVAMMEQECVHRKHWVTRERFESSFVFCKMLPGPMAYQMALWVGYEVRGVLGGLLAGICFVLPAATLLYLFAKFYQNLSSLSSANAVLDGMRIGALVIILQSVYSLFLPYRREVAAWIYCVFGALAMVFIPRAEPLIILAGGFLSLVAHRSQLYRVKTSLGSVLLALWWTHFKAGAFVFGTGLAIIPVLQKEIVDVYGWLSQREFLDALAFAQVTPGPVTTMSAFVGYKVAGDLGALTASIGMYLPGALLILGVLPRVRKKLEAREELHQFQIGAVPTVIGCLVTASIGLLISGLTDPPRVGLFIFLLVIQIRMQWPPWLVILLGSGFQTILQFFFF
ncbi:hypothetical protein EBQ90_03045 [bacterium]|nr:hypothetical protein [bacterium]